MNGNLEKKVKAIAFGTLRKFIVIKRLWPWEENKGYSPWNIKKIYSKKKILPLRRK